MKQIDRHIDEAYGVLEVPRVLHKQPVTDPLEVSMRPQHSPIPASESVGPDVAIIRTPKADIPGPHRIEAIKREVIAGTEAIGRHRYFELCGSKQLGRDELMQVIEQLYCFSVFFERLLTLRISRYSSDMDGRVLSMARSHLSEEFGHSILFFKCLSQNGKSIDDILRIRPKMFTRALYGYLSAIITHENEFIANVAIMQAMESLGLQFFSATLPVLEHHNMMSEAMRAHSEADEEHAQLGLEFAAEFDDRTLSKALATIRDIYRLMGFVLDEWLGDRD